MSEPLPEPYIAIMPLEQGRYLGGVAGYGVFHIERLDDYSWEVSLGAGKAALRFTLDSGEEISAYLAGSDSPDFEAVRAALASQPGLSNPEPAP